MQTPIKVEPLRLEFLRPEQVSAGYLKPRLRARIINRGGYPVVIRRAHLVGNKSHASIPWLPEAPVRAEAGESVSLAVTLTWLMARRLRRSGLFLEVECEGGQWMRSAEVEFDDVRRWTLADEIKAAIGVLVLGILWWFMPWGLLLKLPRALQIIAWAVFAASAGWLCSVFYALLWRGESMWGTGLAIGPQRRVRPLTDVLLTSVAVWLVLTAPFAFATYLIDGQQLGVDGTAFTGANHRYFEAIGLYAWHAVDVLPFVEATKTLNWTEPVQDYSRATGALLLLYKGLVLAPVVAAARAAWRARAPREPRLQDGPSVLGHTPPENVPPEATSHPAEVPSRLAADD